MNPAVLLALLRKDLRLFFANRFFAFVTILALAAYVGMYYLLPATVDETLEIGWVNPGLPARFAAELEGEGVILHSYADAAALRAAVMAGTVPAGVAFPPDLMAALAVGSRPTVEIFLAGDVPEELRQVYPLMVEEWVSLVVGRPIQIEADEQVLGVDRTGQPVPPRDRMLPLFAVFVLFIETLGLASLIAAEVAGGTLRALLVTPLRVEGLFVSKAVLGVGLAFSQSTLLMALTGGLSHGAPQILTALLLGSLLVTGVAFLLASASKDMMSVMSWGVLAMLLLVEVVHQVVNYRSGWSQIGGLLLALVGYAAAFLALGVVVLRRRFR
jgi:ABC-2 type transport system permease protein